MVNPNLQIKVKDPILGEYNFWKVLFVMQLNKIALKANGLKALSFINLILIYIILFLSKFFYYLIYYVILSYVLCKLFIIPPSIVITVLGVL